ncbi:uncharacterized ATP-dependent helicase C29A10.10c-like [Solanum stenotomum]|uniref:uncharacterized ATP-dependent helicase C29A10.10c-like n=1 Tax=Solanum stenotomum TaxID=172797 RepID=UPI0020D15FCF|nr:uncharacterized ATP-dependent helicase C29A10.10c-like [Solanum stenotomum]
MSCVYASGHGIGFVADIRRMNVALIRARRALWVMGNANALVQSEDWAALIANAKTIKCYMDMDTLPNDFLLPNVASHVPPPTNMSNNRGLRSGLRHRIYDPHMESRSGTPSEDDEKPNALHRRQNTTGIGRRDLRLVDGTATQVDLMCNMVWYKVVLGDARMEGYMEVDNTAGQADDFVFRILFDKRILVNEENGWVCQKGRDPG